VRADVSAEGRCTHLADLGRSAARTHDWMMRDSRVGEVLRDARVAHDDTLPISDSIDEVLQSRSRRPASCLLVWSQSKLKRLSACRAAVSCTEQTGACSCRQVNVCCKAAAYPLNAAAASCRLRSTGSKRKPCKPGARSLRMRTRAYANS
jgi:hypothetical protein